MRKLVAAIAVLILSAGVLGAQTRQFITEKLSRHLVEFVYEYAIVGLEDEVVTGTAAIQDNCFKMEMGYLKVFCDGESIWTLDFNEQEAYIEKAYPLDLPTILELAQFNEDGTIDITWTDFESNNSANITLSEIKYKNKSGNMELFRPSPDSFEGDWIITDLR